MNPEYLVIDGGIELRVVQGDVGAVAGFIRTRKQDRCAAVLPRTAVVRHRLAGEEVRRADEHAEQQNDNQQDLAESTQNAVLFLLLSCEPIFQLPKDNPLMFQRYSFPSQERQSLFLSNNRQADLSKENPHDRKR